MDPHKQKILNLRAARFMQGSKSARESPLRDSEAKYSDYAENDLIQPRYANQNNQSMRQLGGNPRVFRVQPTVQQRPRTSQARLKQSIERNKALLQQIVFSNRAKKLSGALLLQQQKNRFMVHQNQIQCYSVSDLMKELLQLDQIRNNGGAYRPENEPLAPDEVRGRANSQRSNYGYGRDREQTSILQQHESHLTAHSAGAVRQQQQHSPPAPRSLLQERARGAGSFLQIKKYPYSFKRGDESAQSEQAKKQSPRRSVGRSPKHVTNEQRVVQSLIRQGQVQQKQNHIQQQQAKLGFRSPSPLADAQSNKFFIMTKQVKQIQLNF